MMRRVCGGGGVLVLLILHTGNSLFSPLAAGHLTTTRRHPPPATSLSVIPPTPCNHNYSKNRSLGLWVSGSINQHCWQQYKQP